MRISGNRFAAESGEGLQEAMVGNFYVKYKPSTNESLITNTKSGEIRTYYKPDGRTNAPFQDAVDLAMQKTGQ